MTILSIGTTSYISAVTLYSGIIFWKYIGKFGPVYNYN